ncbi:7-dehydrocholesterol reductase [Sarotherodon galilaeus]
MTAFPKQTSVVAAEEEFGVKATLTADRLTIPAGGSVTLTCDVKHSADFEYGWYREPRFNSNQKTAVAGHGVNITVTADNTTIPAGGSVTLTCDVKHSADLKYEWVRETSPAVKSTEAVGSDKVIRISKGGKYQCRGWRTDTTLTLIAQSDPVIIQETDKPKAKLRADNTAVPVGGSVTLTCSVNPSSSSGWKYYWYRDEKSSEALTTQDAVFHSNGQISVSQEGLYRCRGGRGNPVYYTEDSQSVRIGKTDSCFTRWIQSESHSPGSSTNHGVNQNETHEYNSLHPGDANLYESITREEDTGTGKHHKPEQSAVYSEVKTGAAGGQ